MLLRYVMSGVLGFAMSSAALAADLPSDALPDAVVAHGEGQIKRAWLAEPTTRYGHGILGDSIEAGALVAELDDGRRLHLRLPTSSVFEDRFVRLADFDNDGVDELVVVESSLNAGAALAVYGLRGGALRLVARDHWIGTRNRWLNPAGIADFDGDGALEVAVVITPHIGGTLKLLRPGKAQRMTVVASEWGFSNHAIGSRDQGLSAVIDWNGDGVMDLLLPNDARDTVVAVTVKGGSIQELARYPLGSSVDGNFSVHIESGRPTVHVPMANGTTARLQPR